jgi:hypothetical protein
MKIEPDFKELVKHWRERRPHMVEPPKGFQLAFMR